MKIFDEDINLTGKSFEDLFTLIPMELINKTLPKDFIDVSTPELGYRVNLTESGDLILEFPNAFYRWSKRPPEQYCIDSRNGSDPRFWTIPPTDGQACSSKNSDKYLVYATAASCFFIFLVLVVYLMLPELQNLRGLILMAYLFSLMVAFLLLVVNQNTSFDTGCIGFASGIYFFFLAAFCWMSVMSFDMWSTFRNNYTVSRHRRREELCKFFKYSLYAWGVPLLMTIFMNVVNAYKHDMKDLPWFITPRIPEYGCFLHGGVKLLYLYVPMLILIICNWVFYLMTAFHIWRSHSNSAVLDSDAAGQKQAHRDQKQMLMVYLKLSVVMGLTWLLEVISFIYCGSGPSETVWIISDAYNSLIGLLMFLIFVCKKKILRKLYVRCGFRKVRWLSNITERSKLDSSQDDISLQCKMSSQPNGLYSSAN
ncbi:hypothetical protein PYW07_004362 [Mythimna separata]|uniref:G-protein coupled receptors family 2 profile 2 domain-containing protein n=1 Tax=Mythimna separata TaxID=271217 RepID=A0AAD7YYZ4_MYTSE|nr:hypothetical protein PYW07_004362 [Mythimna separata]